MGWQPTPYAIPSLISAAVSILLVGYVWRHRRETLAKVFLVLLAAIAAWSLAYAVQLSHTSVGHQLAWQRLGLAIGATLPTIWLAFTVVYAGNEHRLSRPVVGLLLVDPVAFVLLALTNGSHQLLWSSAALGTGPGLDLAFTPVYLVHITYVYLLVVAGIAIIISVFLQSSAIYRRQAGLLVLGAAGPLVANVAFTLGTSPVPGLDLTTTAFTLTSVVFALGLFRFDLLDLTPVARRRVLDEFGSGILVADDEGRVVHANDTARGVLPGVVIGTPVTELLSVEAVAAVDGLVSEVEVDGRRRFHEFSVSTLRDFRGRQVGHVIALQDVTTNREYEQRLEVTNRLLRHNLRNDMNKVLGWTAIALEKADGEVSDALGRIETIAQDVADMSNQARRIETTLGAREEDLVAVDLDQELRAVVEDLEAVWPAAEIVVSTEGTGRVLAPEADLLATALRNLVENGIEHNDREAPRVEVDVETVTAEGDRRVAVSVADDGPGIPDIEREAMDVEKETALSHGSGLGLWLVRWITQTAGGELHFEENEPRGSFVTMCLRPA